MENTKLSTGNGGMNANYMGATNISQFLLNKGSSGNLKAFDNEYSYKINLDNINANGESFNGMTPSQHLYHKNKSIPKA